MGFRAGYPPSPSPFPSFLSSSFIFPLSSSSVSLSSLSHPTPLSLLYLYFIFLLLLLLPCFLFHFSISILFSSLFSTLLVLLSFSFHILLVLYSFSFSSFLYCIFPYLLHFSLSSTICISSSLQPLFLYRPPLHPFPYLLVHYSFSSTFPLFPSFFSPFSLYRLSFSR